MSATALLAKPQALMITPGEQVVSRNFNNKSDVDEKWIKFRKETVYKVKKGSLHVIPPLLVKMEDGEETKWGDSNFSRAGLVGLPKDYVCYARWKYLKPKDPTTLTKGLVYIDLGHRMIRATFSREGTTLMLENHLVGREKKDAAIILQEAPDLKLEHGKWYTIITEVKGDEVVIQIFDHVLYGKHALIAGDRYDTFNFDSTGDGFLIDSIEVRVAGDYKSSWETKRKQLMMTGTH
jgi:hypothetical protein